MPVTSASLSSLGTAALDYAARAWPVFPLHTAAPTCSCGAPSCERAGKHPRTKNGLKDATTNLDQVHAWWSQFPEANIGIVTGAVSGLAVVDVDANRDGLLRLGELEAKHGTLPETPTAQTGGGGMHLLFSLPVEGLTNSINRIAQGIDVRAEGGYIVAPPSRHASGRIYAWSSGFGPGDVPLAVMPTWLLERARRKLVALSAPPSSPHPLTDRIKRASAYLRTMPASISGQGGHDAAWRAALALVRGFDLPTAVALDLLAGEFNPRCKPAWSADELRHKVETAERDAELSPGYLLDDPKRAWKSSPAPRVAASIVVEKSDTEPPSGREPGDDSDETPSAGPPGPPDDPNAWQGELARTKEGNVKNSYGNVVLILRSTWRERLTYDEMQEQPFLDGKALRDPDIGIVRERLEREWGIAPSKDNAAEAIRQVACEKTFHPIRRYLKELKWDATERFAQVAVEVLGIVPSSLNLRILKSWFVSAVARAIRPGCKVDTGLVLVGPQGFFKSTFFAVLGGAWFADTSMDIASRDGLLQLASAWIYEWPEIETVTTRRHASEVKAFMSVRVDSFRPPFGRGVIQHPRSTVIVGTTNETQFLNDPTGSRRFWILQVARRIDAKILAGMRDQLWAEAVALFESGYEWWLNLDEEFQRQVAAEEHEIEDSLVTAIAGWLDMPEARRLLHVQGYIRTGDILQGALKLEPGKWDRRTETRVGVAMTKLKWPKERRRVGPMRIYVYVLPPKDTE
jgi:hypothetical protein